MKGKLIVLEGIDGSGKATQAKILAERLRTEGHNVRMLDFPQYSKNISGALIGECLRGERGDFLSIDARVASVLYAVDRFESKQKILDWLEAGDTVVLDRYVSSNQIHQGSKIQQSAERETFLAWLDTLEYGVFGLPKPDMVLYLDMPVEMAVALLVQKTKDVAENDKNHLSASRKTARWLATRNGWTTISCVRRGVLLNRESVAEAIFAEVRKSAPY